MDFYQDYSYLYALILKILQCVLCDIFNRSKESKQEKFIVGVYMYFKVSFKVSDQGGSAKGG